MIAQSTSGGGSESSAAQVGMSAEWWLGPRLKPTTAFPIFPTYPIEGYVFISLGIENMYRARVFVLPNITNPRPLSLRCYPTGISPEVTVAGPAGLTRPCLMQ